MKTENFNKEERYIAPEMEALGITPGTVLNQSCPTYSFECINDGSTCPEHVYDW